MVKDFITQFVTWELIVNGKKIYYINLSTNMSFIFYGNDGSEYPSTNGNLKKILGLPNNYNQLCNPRIVIWFGKPGRSDLHQQLA